MVKYIKDLLRFHDYVIIPELGGFISHYESAKRNMSTSTIAAPSKKIAFNQSLKEDDGLLVNYLISHKDWSKDRAKAKIAVFRREIEMVLQSEGVYSFAGIGKLQQDNNGNIQFYPILKENLLVNSYGLERVVAQPIHRIKEAFEESKEVIASVIEREVEVFEEPAVIELAEDKVYRPWYFRAAAVIGMGFIMTTVGMSLFSGNVSGDQLSLFPVTQTVETFEGLQAQLPNIELEQIKLSDIHLYEVIKNQEVTISTEVAETVIETSVSPSTYHIIVGSFLDKTRMNREIANMQSKGFTVQTLEGPKGYTRVALVFDTTLASKAQKLKDIRTNINPDAWMLGI